MWWIIIVVNIYWLFHLLLGYKHIELRTWPMNWLQWSTASYRVIPIPFSLVQLKWLRKMWQGLLVRKNWYLPGGQSRTQSISFTKPALPLRLVLSLVPQLFFSYCAGLTERFQSAGILVPRAGSSCTREGEPERTLGRIYCCLVPSRSLAHYKGGKF